MKKSHAEVLMEQMSDDVKKVLELVSTQPTLADFHRLEGKVDKLDGRMDVVEAAAKDMSADLAELRDQTGKPRAGFRSRWFPVP